MKIICFLCDQPFEPNRRQKHKLRKHPHLIQICETCHDRFSEIANQKEKEHLVEATHPLSGKKSNNNWKSQKQPSISQTDET